MFIGVCCWVKFDFGNDDETAIRSDISGSAKHPILIKRNPRNSTPVQDGGLPGGTGRLIVGVQRSSSRFQRRYVMSTEVGGTSGSDRTPPRPARTGRFLPRTRRSGGSDMPGGFRHVSAPHRQRIPAIHSSLPLFTAPHISFFFYPDSDDPTRVFSLSSLSRSGLLNRLRHSTSAYLHISGTHPIHRSLY